jgi:hypothetical protein
MSTRWLVRVSSPVVLAGLRSLFAPGLPAQDKAYKADFPVKLAGK